MVDEFPEGHRELEGVIHARFLCSVLNTYRPALVENHRVFALMTQVKASRLPDDVPLLRSMVDDGLLISTPPQDYDDSYSIKYAMAKHG